LISSIATGSDVSIGLAILTVPNGTKSAAKGKFLPALAATARAIEPAAALSRSGHEILVNLTRLQEEPLSETL
jgi:hypothetical protein